MRLQSQTSRTYKGKGYTKFLVVIPQDIIDQLHWKSGDELEPVAKNGKLVIKKT